MIVPRASANLLRAHTRVASRALNASPRYISATPVSRVKDDLGGPGGQQPPPNKPGGPEAVNRNWLTIGGGALAVVAAYAYFSAPSQSKEAAKRKAVELERRAESKAGISAEMQETGRNIAAQTKEQAAKTARDMSGRNKTEQGSFRHD